MHSASLNARVSSRLTAREISRVMVAALRCNVFDCSEDESVIFHDYDLMAFKAREIRTAFPNAINTAAVKANPVVSILKKLVQSGFGLEAASLSELLIAQEAGAPSEKVMFDSPAKSMRDLRYSMSVGVHINMDSLDEVERVSALLRSGVKPHPSTIFGLRINPEISATTTPDTDVASAHSKFGVPISQRGNIMDALSRHSWIHGLHLHLGAQIVDVEEHVSAIADVESIREGANHFRKGSNRIRIMNIGGGLGAAYRSEEKYPNALQLSTALECKCPRLFMPDTILITEFGRYLFANAGWVSSRVEYTKAFGDFHVAVIHVGADMFIRECYHPDQWHHDCLTLDAEGKLRTGRKNSYSIGGPLCFAADFPVRKVHLPKARQGDFIVIRDVGAYTYGMWSRYCSRPIPKIIGYHHSDAGGYRFAVAKRRESERDAIRLWQK